MVNSGTLLICEIVLTRYLEVLYEHPHSVTPEVRQLIADAEADVRRERRDEMLAIQRQVAQIPTETDQASLLSLIARE